LAELAALLLPLLLPLPLPLPLLPAPRQEVMGALHRLVRADLLTGLATMLTSAAAPSRQPH
jgi:hypothetical protein